MKKQIFAIPAALLVGLSIQSVSFAEPSSGPATGKYARTEPFTLDYAKGRTYPTSYAKDVNGAARASMPLNQMCKPSKSFDYETGAFGPALSKHYFTNPQFENFQVIVHVSIPFQKMFVLDRKAFAANGNGLVYAWRTSTGYHDKHFAMSRDEGRMVYGQKGVVSIFSKSREIAMKKLKVIGQKAGAKFTATANGGYVTFADAPEKRVEYFENTGKMNREKAQNLGADIILDEGGITSLVTIRRYGLNYHDYFHSETGFYIPQGGFSSKHVSGESDGALESEVPYMPWALFFNVRRGMATHGAAYRGTLGSPGSHGCVRLFEENACRLFHLVGNTEIASFASLDERTGSVSQKTITGHRAVYVVTGELNPVEKKFQSELMSR